MRVEISEWLFEESDKPTKPRAAACEAPAGWEDGADPDAVINWEELLNTPPEEFDRGQIMALVKNLKTKKGSGKGGKGKNPMKWYECDS